MKKITTLGENRPIKWTNNATNESIVMYYDYRGRRCGKLFYNPDGIWQSSVKFFYNNFTLIQESTASNIITKEFVWDPSEPVATRPLAMKCNVPNLNLLYTHDANKNVTEVLYLATINGLAAHYQYSPFGELRDFSYLSTTPETSNSETNAIVETSNSGPQLMWNEVLSHALNLETKAITETSNSETNAIAETSNSEVNTITETSNSANASPGDLIGWRDTPITEIDIRSFNPFRFSSEYHDDELNLIYYNYRHYDPATGRFLSRDPIEEQGGTNLYNFTANNPINYFDSLGLEKHYPCPKTHFRVLIPADGLGSPGINKKDIGVILDYHSKRIVDKGTCFFCFRKVEYECFYRKSFTTEQLISIGVVGPTKVINGTLGPLSGGRIISNKERVLESKYEPCIPFIN